MYLCLYFVCAIYLFIYLFFVLYGFVCLHQSGRGDEYVQAIEVKVDKFSAAFRRHGGNKQASNPKRKERRRYVRWAVLTQSATLFRLFWGV